MYIYIYIYICVHGSGARRTTDSRINERAVDGGWSNMWGVAQEMSEMRKVTL